MVAWCSGLLFYCLTLLGIIDFHMYIPPHILEHEHLSSMFNEKKIIHTLCLLRPHRMPLYEIRTPLWNSQTSLTPCVTHRRNSQSRARPNVPWGNMLCSRRSSLDAFLRMQFDANPQPRKARPRVESPKISGQSGAGFARRRPACKWRGSASLTSTTSLELKYFRKGNRLMMINEQLRFFKHVAVERASERLRGKRTLCNHGDGLIDPRLSLSCGIRRLAAMFEDVSGSRSRLLDWE
jgi:hypothetical protein